LRGKATLRFRVYRNFNLKSKAKLTIWPVAAMSRNPDKKALEATKTIPISSAQSSLYCDDQHRFCPRKEKP
jgi:hypothetical protein